MALSDSHSQLLVEIIERRHRRLVAAGIPDEPVEVQLRKIRHRSKAVGARSTRRLPSSFFLAHRIAFHFDPVSVVNQPVEDTVRQSGVLLSRPREAFFVHWIFSFDLNLPNVGY